MIENILQSMKIHHAMSDMQEREKAAQSWNIKIWRKSNLAIFHLKPELTKTHLDWYWQLVQIQRETQQNWNKGPFSEFCLCLHKILNHGLSSSQQKFPNSKSGFDQMRWIMSSMWNCVISHRSWSWQKNTFWWMLIVNRFLNWWI